LCRDIVARHDIPAERVLAHSDVAPGRKKDPGEKFPWPELANAGVGLWPSPVPLTPGDRLIEGASGPRVLALQEQLATYGYPVTLSGRYDEQTVQVVTAFQRHFRPALVDGVADSSTVSTLAALLQMRRGNAAVNAAVRQTGKGA
jgi:N-acetylmuramoyl-L-alanine amidase